MLGFLAVAAAHLDVFERAVLGAQPFGVKTSVFNVLSKRRDRVSALADLRLPPALPPRLDLADEDPPQTLRHPPFSAEERGAYRWALAFAALRAGFDRHKERCARCRPLRRFPRCFAADDRTALAAAAAAAAAAGREVPARLHKNCSVPWHALFAALSGGSAEDSGDEPQPPPLSEDEDGKGGDDDGNNEDGGECARLEWGPASEAACVQCRCALGSDAVVLCERPRPRHILCRACADALIAALAAACAERPARVELRCMLCGGVRSVAVALGAAQLPLAFPAHDSSARTRFAAMLPRLVEAGRALGSIEHRTARAAADADARAEALDAQISAAFAGVEAAVVRALRARREALSAQLRVRATEAHSVAAEGAARLAAMRERAADAVVRTRMLATAAASSADDTRTAALLLRRVEADLCTLDTALAAEGAWTAQQRSDAASKQLPPQLQLPQFAADIDAVLPRITSALEAFGQLR